MVQSIIIMYLLGIIFSFIISVYTCKKLGYSEYTLGDLFFSLLISLFSWSAFIGHILYLYVHGFIEFKNPTIFKFK